MRNMSKVISLGAVLMVACGVTAHAADPGKGAALYGTHCTSCHGSNGEGTPGMPDFKRSQALMKPHKSLFDAIKLGKGIMPGFNGLLKDEQIDDLIAYLRTLPL